MQVEQLEREYRLWSTFQKSLSYAMQHAADENLEHIEESREPEEDEPLWWDMLEEFASRRNEPWRVELFANSPVLNDKLPGVISLKALWELGMMESSDFAALSVFCNSSLYVNGKPIVLMESEEQYGYQFQVNEHQLMNFALCVTKLMDRGLIQKFIVEVDASSPMELMHQSGITCLTHEVPRFGGNVGTAVRLDAFAPTEFCLEICQLYPPELMWHQIRTLKFWSSI